MLDTIKNALFASLGLVAITQDKLKSFVEDWVKRGELTAEQGKKLLEELLQRSQTEGKALSDRIAEEVVRVLEKSPFATRRDLRLLEERVRTLESRLGSEAPLSSDVSGEGLGSGATGLEEDVGV